MEYNWNLLGVKNQNNDHYVCLIKGDEPDKIRGTVFLTCASLPVITFLEIGVRLLFQQQVSFITGEFVELIISAGLLKIHIFSR
jgi:hypothetical protein